MPEKPVELYELRRVEMPLCPDGPCTDPASELLVRASDGTIVGRYCPSHAVARLNALGMTYPVRQWVEHMGGMVSAKVMLQCWEDCAPEGTPGEPGFKSRVMVFEEKARRNWGFTAAQIEEFLRL
jgi:hypothetical protein